MIDILKRKFEKEEFISDDKIKNQILKELEILRKYRESNKPELKNICKEILQRTEIENEYVDNRINLDYYNKKRKCAYCGEEFIINRDITTYDCKKRKYGIVEPRYIQSIHTDGDFPLTDSITFKISFLWFIIIVKIPDNLNSIKNIFIKPCGRSKFPGLIGSYIELYVADLQ